MTTAALSLRTTSKSILGPDAPEMSGRGPGADDEQLRALVPAGRRGTVEDVAAAVCYLASDDARYVNGHDLVVDGGWRAKQACVQRSEHQRPDGVHARWC